MGIKRKLDNFFALGIEKLGLTSFVFLPSLEKLLPRKDEKGQRDLSIMLLCKGNICRSPYAEQKLLQLLKEHSLPCIQVQSAGLDTTPGKPADPTAQEVAKKKGIELSGHVTKTVNQDILLAANLIFVMEPDQLRFVSKHFPGARKKSFLLGALSLSSTKKITICDPFEGTETVFTQCFEQIDVSLKKLVEVLVS